MKIPFVIVLLTLLAASLSSCAGDSGVMNATLDPALAQGKQLFNENCASCHALTPDTVLVGPSMTGIATRLQSDRARMEPRAYLEQSIRMPDADIVAGFPDVMPEDFSKRLSDEQIEALIDLLMTLE